MHAMSFYTLHLFPAYSVNVLKPHRKHDPSYNPKPNPSANLNPHLIVGIFGVPIINRDVKESNKRGSGHIHGQHHGGATPNLIADVAEDHELRSLILAGLDTQLQAEIPFAYHLVGIASRILRIGLRRDAAADIPRPDKILVREEKDDIPLDGFSKETWIVEKRRRLNEDWLPHYTRHSTTVVGNRNVHRHGGSCLMGPRGNIGCRYCAPWGHDVNMTRCVELFVDETRVPESERIEYRCSTCHADGAISNTSLKPETRARLIAEADRRRDLCYVTGNPTPCAEMGKDARVLHVDLKRSALPSLETIKIALAVGNAPDAIVGLRRVLRDMITGNGELATLLAGTDYELVRARLMELTEQPLDGNHNTTVLNLTLSLNLVLSLTLTRNLNLTHQ